VWISGVAGKKEGNALIQEGKVENQLSQGDRCQEKQLFPFGISGAGGYEKWGAGILKVGGNAERGEGLVA